MNEFDQDVYYDKDASEDGKECKEIVLVLQLVGMHLFGVTLVCEILYHSSHKQHYNADSYNALRAVYKVIYCFHCQKKEVRPKLHCVPV